MCSRRHRHLILTNIPEHNILMPESATIDCIHEHTRSGNPYIHQHAWSCLTTLVIYDALQILCSASRGYSVGVWILRISRHILTANLPRLFSICACGSTHVYLWNNTLYIYLSYMYVSNTRLEARNCFNCTLCLYTLSRCMVCLWYIEKTKIVHLILEKKAEALHTRSCCCQM
jgi:hypothetical protein